MALADDLVQAVAEAIARTEAKELPGLSPERWEPEARAAIAATLRAFVATGGYPVDKRSILEVASAVERGEDGT